MSATHLDLSIRHSQKKYRNAPGAHALTRRRSAPGLAGDASTHPASPGQRISDPEGLIFKAASRHTQRASKRSHCWLTAPELERTMTGHSVSCKNSNELGFEQLLATDCGRRRRLLSLLLLILTYIQYLNQPKLIELVVRAG